jgi:hypothetical protein
VLDEEWGDGLLEVRGRRRSRQQGQDAESHRTAHEPASASHHDLAGLLSRAGGGLTNDARQ